MRLEFDGVSVRFGAIRALDGVSFPVQPGEVTTLVGPNGAGKSTLIGVVTGLVRPDGGAMVCDGERLRHSPLALRARLAYLPEAIAFSEGLSGRQVLQFFASARRTPRARIQLVLERIGLAAAADRAVREYSRGMRQRLGLGVALLPEAELLVLDEPTGGLDQEGLSVLWEVLTEARARGASVLLSTHDLALIERRTDQMVVLQAGQVRAIGSPERLRRESGLPVRIAVEMANPAASAGLAQRLSPLAAEGVSTDGMRVELAVTHARLLDALRVVEDERQEVAHLRVEEPGLDAVYEQLLRGAE